DCAWTWRHLLPDLAAAGYRAVAPFLRGYAPTSVAPDGRYDGAALADDVGALHAVLGGDSRAVLIGHDWGAVIAYAASVAQPDKWSKVVASAVPPGPAFITALLTDYRQQKRSWYMFLFQMPLADIIVAGNDLAFIDGLWEDWSPGYDASDDVPRVKDSLRDPANLSAALGYYRAMFGEASAGAGADLGSGATQPRLYLHGANDGCVGVEWAGPTAEVIQDAGHFLHVEKPVEVNQRILEFLAS
ncbi:MAG: alpha/beta hydrolase, partial [Actinobacteria bacterium]|nr:alpha/beta hydrolase [Actinomycetota bacterium]